MNLNTQDKLAALLIHIKESLDRRKDLNMNRVASLLDDADVAEFMERREKDGNPRRFRIPVSER